MAEETHVSPSGLEFPNPKNSVDHPDVGPLYVSPDEAEREVEASKADGNA